MNFARPNTGEYRATLRRDAWYLGETITGIGNVTPSGANIVLNMDGSASFAGAVQSGGNTFGGSPQPGVILSHEGAVVVARGTSSVFIGKDTADGSTTSEITYDGTATFEGDGIVRGTLSITGSGSGMALLMASLIATG